LVLKNQAEEQPNLKRVGPGTKAVLKTSQKITGSTADRAALSNDPTHWQSQKRRGVPEHARQPAKHGSRQKARIEHVSLQRLIEPHGRQLQLVDAGSLQGTRG
jgi:hypothetical protein